MLNHDFTQSEYAVVYLVIEKFVDLEARLNEYEEVWADLGYGNVTAM
jgi:hypothetical protein